MKIGEKRRKKRKIKILTTLSLLTIAGVSLMSYENTNNTREWIDVEPMVVSGYNFGAALKADRNSLDMGK